MSFRHRSSPRIAFKAPSPIGIASRFQERLDANQIPHLVKVGETDLNALVQSSKESCLVYNIIDRFNAGDASVLSKVTGAYADIADFPKTLADVHNLVRGIEDKFRELPLNVREAFNNSPQVFAKKLEDGSYGEILSKVLGSSETVLSVDQTRDSSSDVSCAKGQISE